MVISRDYHPKTSIFLFECRNEAGDCFYRRYASDGREQFLFSNIAPTTCEDPKFFTVRTVQDGDDRLTPVANIEAIIYIGRATGELEGKDMNPAVKQNDKTIRDFNSDRRTVHETSKGHEMMPIERKLVDELIGLRQAHHWQPSKDHVEIGKRIRGDIPEEATAPSEERAPDGFSFEDWKDGKVAPSTTQTGPAKRMSSAEQTAAATPKSEQHQDLGKKQTRTERVAAK